MANAQLCHACIVFIPSCVQMNTTWYKGGGNRRPQNEDEMCNQPKSWEKPTLPQSQTGLPWYPMPIGYQDIFEITGFPSFFKNFGVKRSTSVERELVLEDAQCVQTKRERRRPTCAERHRWCQSIRSMPGNVPCWMESLCGETSSSEQSYHPQKNARAKNGDYYSANDAIGG